MFRPNVKIIRILENKINTLKKLSKSYTITHWIISFSIIMINIASIVLAIIYLDLAAEIIVKSNKFPEITSKNQIWEILSILKLTAWFAIFLILVFIFSIVLAIFSSSIFYSKYRKIRRELDFLITKYQNSKASDYSWEEFRVDLLTIEPFYLQKYRRKSLKKTLIDALGKKVN